MTHVASSQGAQLAALSIARRLSEWLPRGYVPMTALERILWRGSIALRWQNGEPERMLHRSEQSGREWYIVRQERSCNEKGRWRNALVEWLSSRCEPEEI